MSKIQYFKYIIGADECGYGPLAGPVVVCGVKAPINWHLNGLNDSKKLSKKKRELMRDKLFKLIEDKQISFHIAERSNTEIDELGVAVALKDSYVEVFHKLYEPEAQIITDGILKFDNLGVDAYNIRSVVKADTQFPTVMAASILAKTYRDDKMTLLHNTFPVYNWKKNSGYGSKEHLTAIDKYGPCVLHRFSYAPMRNMSCPNLNQNLKLSK